MTSHFLHWNRRIALIAAIFAFSGTAVFADTLKLKNGQTYEGKLTYEGSDFIKFEVPISATIKDTKVIPRDQIAEIIKAAPDDEALSELRKKLPAPSLMSAEAYRDLIESGPKRFLTEFPSSQHKAEVEKILADLTAELDKVERGSIKVEGKWISPQERKDFKVLTDSRIRGVILKRKLAQNDPLGSLRDFEVLDEQFYGTPAHVEAIPKIKELLPAFGQQLTRALQDVEYRKKKYEEDKALLDEVARAQVEAARAQEEANFKQAVEREKQAGVKWLTISDKSAESLSGTIESVKAEIARLNTIDVAALKAASEKLVQADELIVEQKLEEAEAVIEEAEALTGTPASTKKFGGSRKKSTKGGSYLAALNGKIKAVEEAIKLEKKQKEEAAKGDLAAQAVKAGEKAPLIEANPGEAAEEGEKPQDQGASLTSLMAAGAKEPEKEEEGKAGKSKSSSKKSSSKKSTKESDNDDDEEEEKKKPRPAVADSGGGISFQMIMIGVAVLMAIAIGVMKALGIGGNKEGAE